MTTNRNHPPRAFPFWSALFLLCVLGAASGAETESNSKPNIIVILADDLGYSDLGCYGSEIETPRLDDLARKGLRFTQMYNAARCCPSRASLLTGLYQHQAGVGFMVYADWGPGYEGSLNENGVTLGEALKEAGYSTFTSGKWHAAAPRPLAPREPWLRPIHGGPHPHR